MAKYGLFTKFVTKENQRDEFATILLEVSRNITSKGLHQFLINKDLEDPDCIFVSEIWDSKEDHENSLKEKGNKEAVAKAIQLLASKPAQTQLEVLGGKGI